MLLLMMLLLVQDPIANKIICFRIVLIQFECTKHVDNTPQTATAFNSRLTVAAAAAPEAHIDLATIAVVQKYCQILWPAHPYRLNDT